MGERSHIQVINRGKRRMDCSKSIEAMQNMRSLQISSKHAEYAQ
jgi:hypothetical protein